MINRHLDPYGYMIPEIFPTGEEPYDPNLPLHIDDECKVWLDGKDAGQFTLDGTYVDDWIGKGSLEVHAANTNADATRPTYDINTGRVTFIDANGTFLKNETLAVTQPNTIFIVAKITGATNNFIFDGITARQAVRVNNGIIDLYTPSVGFASGHAADANDHIHTIEFNGSSSYHWLDGVSSVALNPGTDNLTDLVIGNHSNFSLGIDGYICEVIIYDASLSDVDRVKIEGYLSKKHDIPVTTD